MSELINNPKDDKVKMLFAFPIAIFGAALTSISMNTFIYSMNIVPGGLSGLSLLTQNLIQKMFHVTISFTLLNLLFNFPPALISFKLVGKKFTIISFILMFVSAFLVDIIPKYHITDDPLLASVFGGILTGFGLSLMLNQGVSGGGTDFISMSISAKFHISAFNYMLLFNIVLIAVQGYNFGVSTALYSIIYQYCSTQIINYMYKRFKKQTLLIITQKPDEVSKIISNFTKHGATKFQAKGCFSGADCTMIYTLLTQPEVKQITQILRSVDPNVFINILETERVDGNFYYAPVGRLS